MNNAKLWLVVKPTTGIPLFLSAVAIGSFAVHVAVLTNTSWVSDYLSGKPLGAGDAAAAMVIDGDENVADVKTMRDGDKVTVMLPDGRRAIAVIEPDKTVVAATD